MNTAVMDFCNKYITEKIVKNQVVMEIGSRNINGIAGLLTKKFDPQRYIGVDIIKDENVDLVLDAALLDKHFPNETFDFIFNTELMEHVVEWKKVISNTKNLLKKGGHLLITTRSKGFNYHACPHDYWRYELEDFKYIFSDMEIIALEKDPESPGVFIFMRKPYDFKEIDLTDYSLYSIVKWKKLKAIKEEQVTKFDIKKNLLYYDWRFKIANFFPATFKHTIKSILYKTDKRFYQK